MTTFEKLAKKIKNDLGIDVENISRTYAGNYMKGSGAFVWCGNEVGRNNDIGGCDTATETLKKDKLETLYHGTGRLEIM
jgi:hypothetical protein